MDEKINNRSNNTTNALSNWLRGIGKPIWGTVLIYIGVAAWLPYFYLLGAGRSVSVIPFLIVHLVCVVGGGRLRSTADKTGAAPADAGLRLASRILITLGVLAWAPYFYLTQVQNIETAVAPFLLAHLTGVLSGVGIRLYLQFK